MVQVPDKHFGSLQGMASIYSLWCFAPQGINTYDPLQTVKGVYLGLNHVIFVVYLGPHFLRGGGGVGSSLDPLVLRGELFWSVEKVALQYLHTRPPPLFRSSHTPPPPLFRPRVDLQSTTWKRFKSAKLNNTVFGNMVLDIYIDIYFTWKFVFFCKRKKV